MFEKILELIYNLLGLAVDFTIKVVDTYWYTLKKLTFTRFLPLWAATATLWVIAVVLKSPGLLGVVYLLGVVVTMAYFLLASPIIIMIQQLTTHVSVIRQAMLPIVWFTLEGLWLAFLVSRTDVVAKPQLLVVLTIGWFAWIAMRVLRGKKFDDKWLTLSTKLFFFGALILAILPSWMSTIVNQYGTGWRNSIIRPNEIEYQGGKLECFDPVDGEVKCWKSPGPDGTLIFYNKPGADVETGEKLESVTKEDVALYKKQWLVWMEKRKKEKESEEKRVAQASRQSILEAQPLARPSPTTTATATPTSALNNPNVMGGNAPPITKADTTKAPPKPVFVEYVVPEETVVGIQLEEPVRSNRDAEKEPLVLASVRNAVAVNGHVVLKKNAPVKLRIERIASDKKQFLVVFELVRGPNSAHEIVADMMPVMVKKPRGISKFLKKLGKVAGTTAVGIAAGSIVDGKEGAEKGAAAGAAAGIAWVAIDKDVVELKEGTPIDFTLRKPLRIRMPGRSKPDLTSYAKE